MALFAEAGGGGCDSGLHPQVAQGAVPVAAHRPPPPMGSVKAETF